MKITPKELDEFEGIARFMLDNGEDAARVLAAILLLLLEARSKAGE